MTTIEEIISLSKRRGFVYPASDIYGGLGGFYDFGPLGTLLIRNIKDEWWKSMVQMRDDVVGIDSAIIQNPNVWKASGHVDSFTDPLVECKVCHERFRSDQPDEIESHKNSHLKKGIKDIAFTEPKQFNLLFKTSVGVIEDEKSVTYLRGETCQGIFTNFANILSTTRVKIPFGIAQIGKAFRNEVTPGKFLFRVREFEQMELEYFVHPKDADGLFSYWKEERLKWHKSLGLNSEKIRLRQHGENERAFYAADSWDVEYNFPDWGWKELEGIANRTDYDLKTHSKHSHQDLLYTDPVTGEKFTPFVIEPSLGVQRMMLAILFDAYFKDDKRTVLKLHPRLAPYKLAVFPLVSNKPELADKARKIYRNLQPEFSVIWDDRGNIGKRYMAQDEAGTPFCLTIDYQTLEDDTITVRDRDTMTQKRLKSDKILDFVNSNLKGI